MTQTALCHVGIRSPERCTSFADRQRRVPRGRARRKIPSGILPQGESTQTALCHVGIRSPERCTSFADRQRRVPRGRARRKIPSGILPQGESTQTALCHVGISGPDKSPQRLAGVSISLAEGGIIPQGFIPSGN